jgi:hypothetical protein
VCVCVCVSACVCVCIYVWMCVAPSILPLSFSSALPHCCSFPARVAAQKEGQQRAAQRTRTKRVDCVDQCRIGGARGIIQLRFHLGNISKGPHEAIPACLHGKYFIIAQRGSVSTLLNGKAVGEEARRQRATTTPSL